ncbi:MAG: RluA family pseudouridine synthase [Chloracidobacterium sp.]|nr:RluA family pseudouridine synthase [Chloracidobacterium sp.]MDW8216854.1 RluA family pseudouridine synthase [Acidobacteriota bacterium]
MRLEAEVIVPETAHWQRLDEFVRAQLGEWPVAAIRRAVAEGQILVNSRPRTAGWRLRTGDRVAWRLTAARSVAVPPEAVALPTLYEDDFILAVAKPPGMLSHPTPKERTGTLINALLAHPAFGGGDRPMLLHRLDRDTSGVVLVAKNDRATRAFAPLFQAGAVTKTYLALVIGAPETEAGLIDAPIGRTPFLWPRWRVLPDGKPAQTRFTVEQALVGLTLMRFEPLTGRTHQIRIHAAYLGCPLAGDMVYGRKANEQCFTEAGSRPSRHLLHAAEMTLTHPIEKREITLRADLPPDMAAYLTSRTTRIS